MSASRKNGDEALLITALAVLLVGVGLLLRTTGVARGLAPLWPIIVIAVGCFILWLPSLRGRRHPILAGGGIFFVLFGAVALLSSLIGWRFKQSWPLIMAVAGLSCLIAGFIYFGKAKALFIAPAAGFIFLGLLFCLFSFHLVDVSFRHFVITWWPSLLIAGAIVLLIAYGLSRRRSGSLGSDRESDSELK
jgi:hypothetical protein